MRNAESPGIAFSTPLGVLFTYVKMLKGRKTAEGSSSEQPKRRDSLFGLRSLEQGIFSGTADSGRKNQQRRVSLRPT